jgi:Flagellar hook capping protein
MDNPLNYVPANAPYGGANATDKGTKIIRSGGELDKDSFLKILSAELANQDPTQSQDPTAYVSQMAQFTSMEQMSNLNTTMSSFAANSLVGKGVTLNTLDSKGNPYTGVVQAVSTLNGVTTVSVQVNENGQNVYKDFSLKDINTVLNVPDYSLPPLTNMNGNISFLLASSFMGKNVTLSDKDSAGNYLTGSVVGVTKDNGAINVKFKNSKTGEVTSVDISKITAVEDGNTSSSNNSSSSSSSDVTSS